MNFAGFIKNSFIDYPNNISCVVFTFGCNFNCWYCHNKNIIKGEPKDLISEDKIFDFLNKRLGLIDGVVISGGEPTINPEIKNFIKKIKHLGYKVKLDTNGSNPELLKSLIDENLLDFVAMDIKTSFDSYEKLIQTKIKIEDIIKSIKILKNSKIDYEFRTTFSPDITFVDFEKLCKEIEGAKSFAIQKYNPQNNNVLIIPHSIADFEKALFIAKKYVKNSFLRSFK